MLYRKESKYFRVRSLYSAILLHINGGAASCAIATWTVYVVLQKSFDPGRRSSIEFHEMKPPLHASLRPFRKATIGRIRGVARRDAAWPSCSQHVLHRRKFHSCVLCTGYFSIARTVRIRSAVDRSPLNGARKVESEIKSGRMKREIERVNIYVCDRRIGEKGERKIHQDETPAILFW